MRRDPIGNPKTLEPPISAFVRRSFGASCVCWRGLKGGFAPFGGPKGGEAPFKN